MSAGFVLCCMRARSARGVPLAQKCLPAAGRLPGRNLSELFRGMCGRGCWGCLCVARHVLASQAFGHLHVPSPCVASYEIGRGLMHDTCQLPVSPFTTSQHPIPRRAPALVAPGIPLACFVLQSSLYPKPAQKYGVGLAMLD